MKEEQNIKQLPKGWQWEKIERISTVNPKIENKENINDELEVQFIPMKLVEEKINKIQLTETRLFKEVRKGSYTPFINGDVIFAKVTPCMENGKMAIVHSLKNGIGYGSSEFHVLRCNNDGLNKYLFYYIVQDRFRNDAQNAMTGAVGLRRVPKQFIERYQIPLPPKPTQQAIVSKIEELFSELDKGIENLHTAQQQLKTYRQSVLNKLVTTENLMRIEKVIDKLDQGWSPKCENEASTDKKEWAVIKTSAVQHGYFVDIENKRLPKELKPREQHELEAGDILITRAGPRVRVGVCCMIKHTRPKLINCDKVYRIKVNKKIITPEYFEFMLNTPHYQDVIEKMKTGISDSGLNLTQKAFVQIEIPIPTIKE